jgi:uncharacterized membrane protein
LLEQLQLILYFFGHGFCHQYPERSFEVSGLYFSVCARDTGIYLGLVFTVAVIYIFYLRNQTKPGALSPAWVLVVCVILILPMALDGTTSYLGLRESSNLLRYITGYLCGTSIGILASSVVLGFRSDVNHSIRVLNEPADFAIALTATALVGAAFYLLYPLMGIIAPFVVVLAQLAIIAGVNLLIIGKSRKWQTNCGNIGGINPGIGKGQQLAKILIIAIMLALMEIALMAGIAHLIHLVFPDFVHP